MEKPANNKGNKQTERSCGSLIINALYQKTFQQFL